MKNEQIIKTLCKHDIPFFITGSFAVNIYTGKRDYNDIDIVIREEDKRELEILFGKEFELHVGEEGEYFETLEVSSIEFSTFSCIRKNGREHFLGFTEDKYKKLRSIQIKDCVIKLVEPEELIILKLLKDRNSNGKFDREDIIKVLQSTNVSFLNLTKLALKYGVFKKLLSLLPSISSSKKVYSPSHS